MTRPGCAPILVLATFGPEEDTQVASWLRYMRPEPITNLIQSEQPMPSSTGRCIQWNFSTMSRITPYVFGLIPPEDEKHPLPTQRKDAPSEHGEWLLACRRFKSLRDEGSGEGIDQPRKGRRISMERTKRNHGKRSEIDRSTSLLFEN